MKNSIFDEVNQQLENKEIDSAQIAAIGFTPSFGRFAQMDDGERVALSDHDYWLLDNNLEAMHAVWVEQQKASKKAKRN